MCVCIDIYMAITYIYIYIYIYIYWEDSKKEIAFFNIWGRIPKGNNNFHPLGKNCTKW